MARLPWDEAVIGLFRLSLLRSIERFVAQWISVSTEPSAFVRERMRLGDTTNFLRAANFFFLAVSGAFLAEAATLYLLGAGDLVEPFYWIFMLLGLTPFVLICFVFLRAIVPLSLKDVLHLSFYPWGSGILAGAALALIASAVIGAATSIGYISDIEYDLSDVKNLKEVIENYYYDCMKDESLLFTVL